jgi:cytochrome c oxidase subunit 1
MSAPVHPGPPQTFLRKYVFSDDHKIIGLQYYALSLAAVFIGMFLSWLMRFHLVWPNAAIPGLALLSKTGAPGGIITPEYYLSLLTMHGTLMIFFVLTTAPFAAFGNYFLPIQIGARQMAFPRCNMLSFWITFVSFIVLLTSFIVPDGPPISGWTAYAPLSAIGKDAGPGMATGQDLWIISIALFCIASILSAVNFIATTLDLRTQGMTLLRMPLSAWAWFITSCVSLLAFAVLLPACLLLILDRVAGTSFFVPAGLVVNDHLQSHSGGSPLLWQHLFWFFGHPEVYIAILPAMGIVSHVLINSMRKPLLSYKVVIGCMAAIGFLSFILWGHHMFVSGMNPFSAVAFSIPSIVITIPATIMTLIWIVSLYGSRLQITSASLFALGFISMFVSGGVSGFFLAQPPTDMYLHATYFVVGHFHLVMGVAAIFSIFAATYFWMPKMTGHMMNETLGKIHFWLTFVGTYCIFMPFYYLGLAGNVRRYSSFVNDFMAPLMPVHKFITIAAFFTGAAQFIFLFNLFCSRFWGKPASANPWNATSLEWSLPSPPPWNNFGKNRPVIYHDPYQYGVELDVEIKDEDEGGAETGKDFIMQNSPEQAPERPSYETTTDTTLAVVSEPSKTGIWLGLAAIVMFFAALTSALIVREGSGSDWQPILIPRILYLNTAILIVSSLTLSVARKNHVAQKKWLLATLVLGLAFIVGQYVAWLKLRSAGLYLATNPNSSFLYLLTAVHFVLVCGGIAGLSRSVYSLSMPTPSPRQSTWDATSYYWQFMTLLWIYLLFIISVRL